jgi:TolA-binding protein
MQKHYSASATEFDTVIKQYSDSPKVPEAMLKLALIHENQGKHAQAQTELRQLKKKYPKSAAAKLADQQLQVMN